jgi:hypothetical protein
MVAALHESLADGDVQKFGFAQSSPRPVLSVKMRSGFLDTGLFRENVLAAQVTNCWASDVKCLAYLQVIYLGSLLCSVWTTFRSSSSFIIIIIFNVG